MSSIKVAINGVPGRMAQRVAQTCGEAEDVQVVAALARAGSPVVGSLLYKLADHSLWDVKMLDLKVKASLRRELEVDVVIDFSAPASTVARAQECALRKIPFVSGTTGLNGDQQKALDDCAKLIPLLHAANTSLGINLLAGLVKRMAAALPDYDIEIVEAHHRWKKDAPSGTALELAAAAAEGRNQELSELIKNGREGLVGARKKGEIGIHAMRLGDVIGEHRVFLCGNGERLELAHAAHTRDTFAKGAVAAARFLVGKAPGRYSMKDVLFSE